MLKIITSALTVLAICGANSAEAQVFQPLPKAAVSPNDNLTTPAKVELGKKLFFDPRLSLTGTVSCNSCHNVMEGGDDGRETSMGIHGRLGPRNAQTVWNSAFQGAQFWDGRSPSLEDQAKGPIVAAPEMGMPSHDVAIERIKAIPGYRAEFEKVFNEMNPINIDNAAKALAAFERTLITPDGPFDRYLQGEKSAMSESQIRGMKLFENVGCTECHSGPALNGWQPGVDTGNYTEFPRFTGYDSIKKHQLDQDLGRFEATKKESDKSHFKVPTLRNITLTAPYFHNGKVSNLRDAIRIMAETQLATELSDSEIDDIAAFFEALQGSFPEITLPRLPSRSGESIIDDRLPLSAIEKTAHDSETHSRLDPPRRQGRGRHAGDAKLTEDHEAFFFLLEHRKKITRKITPLKNGVETLTESSNPQVAAKIREHVAAMYDRVKENKPIHMRDPLFREIFRYAPEIDMKAEPTDKGVRVVETSANPYVVKLIQAHAKVVSAFIHSGHQELRMNHAVPKSD